MDILTRRSAREQQDPSACLVVYHVSAGLRRLAGSKSSLEGCGPSVNTRTPYALVSTPGLLPKPVYSSRLFRSLTVTRKQHQRLPPAWGHR